MVLMQLSRIKTFRPGLPIRVLLPQNIIAGQRSLGLRTFPSITRSLGWVGLVLRSLVLQGEDLFFKRSTKKLGEKYLASRNCVLAK